MQLLLAPSGRGKTAHLLQRVRAALAAEPLAPVWIIAPNQHQVQALRRRLAREGGALGVEVYTFYGVYVEVLARAGSPRPRLSEPVQHRLLRGVVDSLCAEEVIEHYRSLRDKPGFLRLLRSLILELKQARIFPEDWRAALAGTPPRLAELALIYERYQRWLNDIDWADGDGQGWLAAIALEEDPALCAELRLLAVDGFDEFNPTQLAVLNLLAGQAAETLVTLTGDLDGDAFSPRIVHGRFARAYQALLASRAHSANPPLSHLLLDTAIPDLAPPLAHLEANLFRPQAAKTSSDGAITLLEAQNPAQEVRAALRWIKERLVLDGLALDQVAVLTRDLASYRAYLREVAGEFGLPLHLAEGSDLAANPAVAALLNLLSLPVLDWPQRAVLDAWRSPYFDWSGQLTPGWRAEDVAVGLDAVARNERVTGGLAQWREAFERLASKRPADAERLEDDDKETAPANVPAGEQACQLRQIFDAFVARLQPPRQAEIPTFVAFVEDLMGDDPQLATRFQAAEAEADDSSSLRMVAAARQAPDSEARDLAALQAVKDVLRGLMLAERIATDEKLSWEMGPVSYRRFFDEFRSAVDATCFQPSPPEHEAVLAASVLRARGLSFQAVALLGLAEGQFPQAEREDVLLSEVDRIRLRQQGIPLESRLRGDEATFFYEAITRARCQLLLTRSYLADDGQSWEPSPYWEEVRRLVDIEPQSRRPEDSLALEQAASPPELLDALARSGQAPVESSDADLAAAWQAVEHAAAIFAARLARRAGGPFEGDLGLLRERLAVDYPPDHIWSSSRLETYAACPFNFFTGSGLELEPRPRPEPGFDPLILGSIYHEILEKVYREALAQGEWSPETLLALLDPTAQAVFAAAPRQYGFRPLPLWDYQKQELQAVLQRTLTALAEAAGDYRPLALEQAFGLRGKPPLQVQREKGAFRLRGFIDRIDRGPHGDLRIIDYKSSSSPIAPKELNEGRRVQLPLYALAAQETLRLGRVESGFYWHIGSARASSLKLESYEGGVDAALETAISQALAIVDGIRAGHFEPAPPAGGCPASCPAAGFCWRYRPRNH